MSSVLIFVLRLLTGLVVLALCWFVMDRIHDRNTKIIASVIGLLYCFVFVISRRLDHFGLSVFSIFGRTVSSIHKVPYDDVMRGEIGSVPRGQDRYLNLLFVTLIEILCVVRLLTSLLDRGWDVLSDPIDKLTGNTF